MSGNTFDQEGEAREALSTAVSSYGPRVLGDPRVLGNLVTDLLPDLPRERSLLVTAAEAGVAGELSQHVEQQHVDVDTAIQLVARSLTERRLLDGEASTWVTTEYAQALGYPVPAQRAATPPQPPRYPDTEPLRYPDTEPNSPSPPARPTTPVEATIPPAGPPQAATPPAAVTPPTPAQAVTPPAPPVPPATGDRATSGLSSHRGPLIIAGAIAGALVVYLIVAAVASLFPFSKSSPHPVSGPTPPLTSARATTPSPAHTSPSPPASPTVPASPSLAPGITPLVQLLPSDIDDTSTECTAATGPFSWKMAGLVTGLRCTDPGLPGGKVFAYQLDSSADYQTTWQNFNRAIGFNPSIAGSACPPPQGDAQGTSGWHNKTYPPLNGQVVECGTIGSGKGSQVTYVWSEPTQDSFFEAQASHGWTFAQLQNWWANT